MQIEGVDSRTPVKSFQGEGPYAQKRIVVLRFMRCNLKCHWNTADGMLAWCDTKWTWDGSEQGRAWDVDLLAKEILRVSRKHLAPAPWEAGKWTNQFTRAGIVMITGGEPMLRQNDEEFQMLVQKLHESKLAVHIETNGTLPPNVWAQKNIDFFAVSPKYQLYPAAYSYAKIKQWADSDVQMAWKFVVGRPYDVEQLRQWLFEVKVPFGADVWLMPLTNDSKEMDLSQNVLESGVVEGIKMLGYQHVAISPRLQIGRGRDNFP